MAGDEKPWSVLKDIGIFARISLWHMWYTFAVSIIGKPLRTFCSAVCVYVYEYGQPHQEHVYTECITRFMERDETSQGKNKKKKQKCLPKHDE